MKRLKKKYARFPSVMTNIRHPEVEMNMPVLSSTLCNQTYGPTVATRSICIGYWIGGVAPCYGDSGSGVMVEVDDGHYVIAGVVTGGSKACGIPNQPAVAIDVSYYQMWLVNTIGGNDLRTTHLLMSSKFYNQAVNQTVISNLASENDPSVFGRVHIRDGTNEFTKHILVDEKHRDIYLELTLHALNIPTRVSHLNNNVNHN